MSVPADIRRRVTQLETDTTPPRAPPPTAGDLALRAAVAEELGRPWAGLTVEEVLGTQAFLQHERATLTARAEAVLPGRRRT